MNLVNRYTATFAVALASLFPAFAFAQSSPGGAIAAGLSDGPTEMGLVFIAVAVLIGLALVWSYIKRSAR